MTVKVANITFDCDDPQRTAAFWSEAIGETIDEGASEYFVSIGLGRPETSPNWFFIKVPEAKAAKNRLHLDLESSDLAADVERLVALGATHVADKEEWGHAWSVMNDVEGNEFCISAPH